MGLLLISFAHAAVYDCEISMTEELPVKKVLEKKTGRTIEVWEGFPEDEYAPIRSEVINDVNCKDDGTSFGYNGNFRIAVTKCVFNHPNFKVSFDTDKGQCFVNEESNVKDCVLEGSGLHEVAMVDKDHSRGISILSTQFSLYTTEDLKDSAKNVMKVNARFMQIIDMGQSSSTKRETYVEVKNPLILPFFEVDLYQNTVQRSFSIVAEDGTKVTDKGPFSLTGKGICVLK